MSVGGSFAAEERASRVSGTLRAVGEDDYASAEDRERIEAVVETPDGRLTLSVYPNGDYYLYVSGLGEDADVGDIAVQGQVYACGLVSVALRGSDEEAGAPAAFGPPSVLRRYGRKEDAG